MEGSIGATPNAVEMFRHMNKENARSKSPRSRAILGLLDTLVDIGVLAEKEVIQ